MNIINVINNSNVPKWGNAKKYIAIHYLGVVGQNNKIEAGGYGAHFYIYWDGTTYQAADLNAILWQVGTGGYYTKKHPEACNSNVIGIELCVKCDGNAKDAADPKWYFTEETQLACVELVKKLMKDLNIPADHVLRHYDIVNKRCPAPYVNNNKYRTSWTWEEFKARLTGSAVLSTPVKESNTSNTSNTTWKAIGTATCTGDGVRVRETPGGTKIGSLGKGNRFEVDGQISGEWVHIKVADIGIGYIHKDYVKYDSTTSTSTSNNNTSSSSGWKAIGTATCTGDGVRVRETPGGTKIGSLGKGNRFEVDGQISGEWVHIKVADIGIGYIHKDYVKYD